MEYIKPIAVELSKIDPAYLLVTPSLEMIDNDEALEEFIKENFGHNHHQQILLIGYTIAQSLLE
ncbi:hypothetical protein DMO16_03955 [Fictibacillus sp. S7]|nr:hypothetical protein DMO16_03955 [Fictibacillus sp. S7]